jgi:hypothetical protein
MNNIARLRKGLSPERKRKIAARTATLRAEERSLQELRRAHKLTQQKMADTTTAVPAAAAGLHATRMHVTRSVAWRTRALNPTSGTARI